MSRLSGPLLDRIDLHVDVPALSFEELINSIPKEIEGDFAFEPVQPAGSEIEKEG
jgi:predicted ATPase with chaperone activity